MTTPDLSDAGIPDGDTIYSWIERIFSEGIRRPGYPADRWAERWLIEQFESIGLHDVHAEPVTASMFESPAATLDVTTVAGERRRLPCMAVPFSAPTERLEVELVRFDAEQPSMVAGRGSVVPLELMTVPATLFAAGGSAPADLTGRIIDDPDGAPGTSLADSQHTVPFGAAFQEVLEPSIAAGAAAFVGVLTGYPGDSHEYWVPYDGIARNLPGVWISGSDGEWLSAQLDAGSVTATIEIASTVTDIETYNIIGELPGADDEVVMIGSHHDGPWASAVEDASGMALVLAQATYWAARAPASRPHRLRFVLHGGHMSGGAGLHRYIEDHRADLDRVVLEIHLEHAALDFAVRDGEVVTDGLAVPRWWFVSRIPMLEAAVSEALGAERLWRSMILAPDAIGEQPPTDGGYYHRAGVPIVNFLAAPWYLFDSQDTLDKIDRDHLVPLTRAVIRVVDSTLGVSARGLRNSSATSRDAATGESDRE